MAQLNMIKIDIPKRPIREKPVVKIQPKPKRIPEIEVAKPDELELEAMALELDLELLEFN